MDRANVVDLRSTLDERQDEPSELLCRVDKIENVLATFSASAGKICFLMSVYNVLFECPNGI